jgi:hypothetical protein
MATLEFHLLNYSPVSQMQSLTPGMESLDSPAEPKGVLFASG